MDQPQARKCLRDKCLFVKFTTVEDLHGNWLNKKIKEGQVFWFYTKEIDVSVNIEISKQATPFKSTS